MYGTVDRVRFLRDAQLEYLGRISGFSLKYINLHLYSTLPSAELQNISRTLNLEADMMHA